jgi:hypothetical protein
MSINDRDDLRAQSALEGRLPGFWQVYRASEPRRPRDVEVPPGHYWAAFWRWSEPPVVAETLDELERKVLARMETMTEPEPRPAGRSILRELLGEDADRFEVAPGRWYLPGSPP